MSATEQKSQCIANSCNSLHRVGSVAGASGAWQHMFRHRSLPPEGERVYWHCAASAGWRPTQWHKAPKLDECPF